MHFTAIIWKAHGTYSGGSRGTRWETTDLGRKTTNLPHAWVLFVTEIVTSYPGHILMRNSNTQTG